MEEEREDAVMIETQLFIITVGFGDLWLCSVLVSGAEAPTASSVCRTFLSKAAFPQEIGKDLTALRTARCSLALRRSSSQG